jgi:hypothetical protein
MNEKSLAIIATSVALWLLPSCTTPNVPPPCDDTTCNTTCVHSGNVSGACASDLCVCQATPPGTTVLGGSSGGVVERASGSYRMRISVGPDEAATGTITGPSHRAVLGAEARTDPSAH